MMVEVTCWGSASQLPSGRDRLKSIPSLLLGPLLPPWLSGRHMSSSLPVIGGEVRKGKSRAAVRCYLPGLYLRESLALNETLNLGTQGTVSLMTCWCLYELDGLFL